MTEQAEQAEQPAQPSMEPDIAPPVAEPAAAAVPPPVRKDRRILRGVLRWTAAVAVFAAVGSATAYGVTGMDRTDVPGLATRTDGRWTYPELTAPPLPTGSPRPFARTNPAAPTTRTCGSSCCPRPRVPSRTSACEARTAGWRRTSSSRSTGTPPNRTSSASCSSTTDCATSPLTAGPRPTALTRASTCCTSTPRPWWTSCATATSRRTASPPTPCAGRT